MRFVTRRLPRLRYQVRFEVEVCYMARFGVALPGAVLGWRWVTRLVLAWRFEARFEVGCGLRGLFWRGVTRDGSRVEAGLAAAAAAGEREAAARAAAARMAAARAAGWRLAVRVATVRGRAMAATAARATRLLLLLQLLRLLLLLLLL